MDEDSHGQIGKLIRETVVMLCKNGVYYERNLTVQGLIGITVDDGNVLLVHMDVSVDGDGVDDRSTVQASASTHQLCGNDTNEQLLAEECHWPKPFEGSLPCVKQEAETSRTVNYQYEESQTIPPSVNASLSLIPKTEFGDQTNDDNDMYVESTSSLASSGRNHEASGIWNARADSVASTPNQPAYESHYSHSARQLQVSRALDVHGDTSQYTQPFGNKNVYGEIGVTHHLAASKSASQKKLQSTPNQMSSQHKMVIVLCRAIYTETVRECICFCECCVTISPLVN